MSWRFFAACLPKLAVLDPTFSGDVASDFYVIRRICGDQLLSVTDRVMKSRDLPLIGTNRAACLAGEGVAKSRLPVTKP